MLNISRYRFLLLGALAWVIITFPALAQNGKSPAARYGIGELQTASSAREFGMGLVSTANPTMYTISAVNPALWSRVQGIRLSGDMDFEYEGYDLNGETFSFTSSRMKSLQLSLPISDDYGIRIVGGVLPVSRVDYKINGLGEVAGESYHETYGGSGGITMFRFGASYQPVSALSIGAAYQYYFGTIEQNWTIDFDNGSFYQSKESRATSHSGSGFTVGVYYSGIDKLGLGLTFSPKSTLDATRNVVFRYSYADSTTTGTKGTLTIPMQLTAGARYDFTKTLRAGLEFLQQNWTDATIFDAKQNQLGNAYKVGAGVEWLPGEEPQADQDYWKMAALRLGFYHAQNYVDMDSKYQSEFGITAGLGIPIFGVNRADLGVEYGWNGTADMPADGSPWLGKRNFIRVSISVSAGEFWFKRRSVYDN